MTVKDLKEALDRFPEDMQVATTDFQRDENADGEQIWHDINGIELMTGKNGHKWVSIYHHEDF